MNHFADFVNGEAWEQAIERAGTKQGNKGFDAAVDAIEMANLVKNMDKGAKGGKVVRN